MIDMFLIIGLVSTVLLSLIVYLVLNLLGKKKGKKTNFFKVLFCFLFVFGLVYGIKINEFFRVICGMLLLAIPATGILYYLRVADKKVDKGLKNFTKTYVGMFLVIFGAIIIVMLYHYRKDLNNIKNDKKPLYAEENSIYTTNNKTCGSTFFEGLGYRVEYCSKYVNKDSYRIKLWVDPNWVYQSNEDNIDDLNWCNCERKTDEEEEKEEEQVEEDSKKEKEEKEEVEVEKDDDKKVTRRIDEEIISDEKEVVEENSEIVTEENTEETSEETTEEIIE